MQLAIHRMTGQQKIKLFVSYSRDDHKFADQLAAALEATGYEPSIDRTGIHAGEDWKERLGTLILDADTVIFVLSPSSAASSVCGWEVEEAVKNGKRILPVLCRPLEAAHPPKRLADLNFIYFYDEPKHPGSGFGSGLADLISAVNSDLDWLREHTRLQQRAAEWDAAGRIENRMLSGGDILAAKQWASHRPRGAPEPTTLHLDYIHASEAGETARQNVEQQRLAAIEAAQAERAVALDRMEAALTAAAVAQRRRIRIRNMALVAVTAAAGIAAWQWQLVEVRRQAETVLLDRATRFIVSVGQGRGLEPRLAKGAMEVFEHGAALGDPRSMTNLGVAFENGRATTADFGKARHWFAEAARHGNAHGMVGLGRLSEFGKGVPRDYALALRWYEKAATSGHEAAKSLLASLELKAAMEAGHFAEAIELSNKLVAVQERLETATIGRPGPMTASALLRQSWEMLYARHFDIALKSAQRASAIVPDRLDAPLYAAHALLFLGRTEEALAIHRVNKGKRLPGYNNQLWEELALQNFKSFRDTGLEHASLVEVERVLSEK